MANLIQAVYRLERMARKVPAERPGRRQGQDLGWTDPGDLAAPERQVDQGPGHAGDLHVGHLATDPATLSLLHTLFYFRSGTSFEILLRFSGGAQQDRLVGGSQVLATNLGQGLGDGLELEAPVRRID